MQSLYIVYTQNQNQKRHLEGQFLEKSGHYAVPFYQLKTLKELIDKTCYEYYQKDESIFIQKLKNMILGLVEFNFSFPLWRQILSTLRRNDMVAEKYRKHLIQVDKFFLENDTAAKQLQFAQGYESDMIDDQFQKALNSYKTLEVIDLEEQILSYPSFNQFDDKLSIKESQKTNDKSVRKINKKTNLQINSFTKIEDRPASFCDTNTPIKMIKKSFQEQIAKYSRHNKTKLSSNFAADNSEFDDFINSFKKQRTSPVAEMILNDESIGKIAKKQKKTQKDRKKLQEQLYEKTKTAKSKQYNKNIKTILLNRKVKDRKKPGFDGLKSQITGVVNAYQLRRVASQIISFDDEDHLKLFKSAGKPFVK